MAIDFVCICGKKLRAKDQHAGRRIRCPECQSAVSVPNPTLVAQPPVFEPLVDVGPETPARQPSARRRWWNDPVVIVGALVPTIVLACFVGYLIREREVSRFRDQVLALKATADRQSSEDQHQAAYKSYGLLLSLAGRSRYRFDGLDEVVRSAKSERLRIYPVVKAAIDREASERRAREEARRREQAAREEEQRLIDESERLAKFTATLSGGAWVIKGGGQSDILRGLTVFLLKDRVQKSDVADLIESAKELIEAETKALERRADEQEGNEHATADYLGSLVLRRWVNELASKPEGAMIDVERLYSVMRPPPSDDPALKSFTMGYIEHGTAWPSALRVVTEAKAVTNIDGKYRFNDIKGGKYYLYALHITKLSLIEWCFPLTIDHSGEVAQDLFNENAELIINRN